MRLNSTKWNQGDMSLNSFSMDRRCATHQVHLDDAPVHVFQDVCLAGQPGWMPAGAMSLACSHSDLNEEGALWTERESAAALFGEQETETFWSITMLDLAGLNLQAALLNPGLAMGTLEVHVTEDQGGASVRFDLSYTVISEAGSQLFDAGLDDRMAALLVSFGQAMAATMEQPVARVITAPHQARREAFEHELVIRGDIDTCFLLVCPVEELRWIDDWRFDLIYSEGGKNETGCIFMEGVSALSALRSPAAKTHWYTTRFDKERHRFDAVWLTGDLTMTRWKVCMDDIGEGQVRVTWSLVYTGLGPRGSALLGEPGLEGRVKNLTTFIATSLKTYVETGSIFRIPSGRKLRMAASLIGAALGRHFRRRPFDSRPGIEG